MRAAIGSQCTLINRGVMCILFGSLKINLADAFWINCKGLIELVEDLPREHCNSQVWTRAWTRSCEACSERKGLMGWRSDAQICLCVQVSLMKLCTRAPGGTVTAAMSLFLPNPPADRRCLRPRPQRPLLSVLQRCPLSSHTSTRSSWPPALWHSLVRDRVKNYKTQETDSAGQND